MFNLQPTAKHPLSDSLPTIDLEIFEQMWSLFVAICTYWETIPDPTPHKTQLLNFMLNRIKLNPLYLGYYGTAADVITRLKEKHGDASYHLIFTDKEAAGENPPTTPLAVTRQRVSNEFVTLHLALGGFKAFGATNYCGYIGGPNVEGYQAPYRTGVRV